MVIATISKKSYDHHYYIKKKLYDISWIKKKQNHWIYTYKVLLICIISYTCPALGNLLCKPLSGLKYLKNKYLNKVIRKITQTESIVIKVCVCVSAAWFHGNNKAHWPNFCHENSEDIQSWHRLSEVDFGDHSGSPEHIYIQSKQILTKQIKSHFIFKVELVCGLYYLYCN